MATVDMGFTAIALDLGLDDVTHWRMFDQSEWLDTLGGSKRVGDDSWFDPDSSITYRNLRGRIDEVLASGPVIYWGDFHHLAAYHRSVATVLYKEIGACASREAADDLVATHLMLRGQERDPATRVASYGSTLLLNGPSDYAGIYGDDLRAFIGIADDIRFRDAYSETLVNDIRGGANGAWRGADCAFLAPSPGLSDREQVMSVFFGRSALQPEQLAWLGRKLSRELDLEPRLLDWGREPAFWPMGHRRRFRLAWPELEHGTLRASGPQRIDTVRQVFSKQRRRIVGAQPNAADLLAQVARSALVLTDTYHLALNAWRVGTPAVCVLDDPTGAWNVNSGVAGSQRDKRWDMYSNLDALPFTVNAASLRPGRPIHAEVDRLAAVFTDNGLAGVVQRRVEGTIERARSTSRATVAAAAGAHE